MFKDTLFTLDTITPISIRPTQFTDQHEYSQMNITVTLLKPLNNPNLFLPHEKYYIQTFHREEKLNP